MRHDEGDVLSDPYATPVRTQLRRILPRQTPKDAIMKVTAAVLALTGAAIAAPAATPAAKYCDAATTLCYNEFVSPGKVVYRFAIPDTATAAPYDIALQIVAPKATGWAGVAWAGSMTNNPLLVAWPNGDTIVASSRFTA